MFPVVVVGFRDLIENSQPTNLSPHQRISKQESIPTPEPSSSQSTLHQCPHIKGWLLRETGDLCWAICPYHPPTHYLSFGHLSEDQII